MTSIYDLKMSSKTVKRPQVTGNNFTKFEGTIFRKTICSRLNFFEPNQK